jgi:hypothetical protein
MKKILVAAAFASLATFNVASAASPGYDFGAVCAQHVEEDPLPPGITMEQMYEGCACLVEGYGDDEAITRNFAEAAGDSTRWSPEVAEAVGRCFPRPGDAR